LRTVCATLRVLFDIVHQRRKPRAFRAAPQRRPDAAPTQTESGIRFDREPHIGRRRRPPDGFLRRGRRCARVNLYPAFTARRIGLPPRNRTYANFAKDLIRFSTRPNRWRP
jgi:hypothetical protein